MSHSVIRSFAFRRRECAFTKVEPMTGAKYDNAMVTRAYARVGLMGNPSDGFGGKTVGWP